MRHAIKFLLIPSWIVGVAAVMMGTPAIDERIHRPFTQIIGHTVLFGVVLAPLLGFVAFVLTCWLTVRRRPENDARQPSGVGWLWLLIALALACNLGAWVVLARGFTS